ncbi:uncharacterized protein LOC142466827 isoform X1 [Ascaphus truei]|uniref:uncharacterized protein LOC142466827 isoform X1 n=1 Tax=Ascaphus truei TaxID=8439 RepID=UPI003F5942C0
MQSSDHEEVPIQRITQAIPPASNTYAAIAASEEKIVEAENRRHSDLMSVHERMISLQEETISQLSHLHRVFIEVPKQIQKLNTTLEAVVVQLTQANHLRMTTTAHHFNFNPSEEGSLDAATFSPHASDLHSPGRDVTGTVAESSVHVPLNIQPLPSVESLELTPTKEAPKRKMHKQLLLTSFWKQTKKHKHETAQASVVHCVPTCSQVSQATSPAREVSQATSPAREVSQVTSPAREVSQATSPAREVSQATSPAREVSQATSPAREVSQATSPAREVSQATTSPAREVSQTTSPAREVSQATSPAREVPQASQTGSVLLKVVAKRKKNPSDNKQACDSVSKGKKKNKCYN